MLAKAGFEVSVVDSFTSLLSALDAPGGRPDLIITDLNMPGGEGPDVLRRITCEEMTVPVVVLTAEGRRGLHEDLISCGAAAVLIKPAEPKALLAEVSRLIGTAKRS